MISNMTIESPLGPILLVCEDSSLTGLYFVGQKYQKMPGPGWEEEPRCPVLLEAAAQLAGYFAGSRRSFDMPLRPKGTAFQEAVWRAIAAIPYGRTASYASLAERIGRPPSVRAVGAAVGRNPISIAIPCHRVIGKDGSLTGYAGGMERKRFLLDLEKLHAPSIASLAPF
jgi:methylated-DNA-[protein]-cysteine S-methyltransferase